jgi:hypothetical protein
LIDSDFFFFVIFLGPSSTALNLLADYSLDIPGVTVNNQNIQIVLYFSHCIVQKIISVWESGNNVDILENEFCIHFLFSLFLTFFSILYYLSIFPLFLFLSVSPTFLPCFLPLFLCFFFFSLLSKWNTSERFC